MSNAAIFDTQFYLTNNADVVVAISQGHFASALDHFQKFGGKNFVIQTRPSIWTTMLLITVTC